MISMRLNQLIEKARQQQPDAFKGVSDATSVALLKACLAVAKAEITAQASGPCRIPGLGVFKSKTVDGKGPNLGKQVHKILFSPAAADDESASTAVS